LLGASVVQEATLAAQQPPPAAALSAPRAKSTKKHAPAFDIRIPLHVLTGGTDLSQIPFHRATGRAATGR
jgi:hypothetical protein